jgi:Kef-type K+ transport system membrane component KefB
MQCTIFLLLSPWLLNRLFRPTFTSFLSFEVEPAYIDICCSMAVMFTLYVFVSTLDDHNHLYNYCRFHNIVT